MYTVCQDDPIGTWNRGRPTWSVVTPGGVVTANYCLLGNALKAAARYQYARELAQSVGRAAVDLEYQARRLAHD